MKLNRFLTYLIAVSAMVIWGVSFVWTKIVFKYYGPLTTVFIRLVISSALLYLIVKLFFKKEKINRKDYKLFMISSFLNPFLYFIGESFGLKLVSPTITAVVISTIPVFTPLAAYFSLKERLSRFNITGIFISFFGILVMILKKNLSINASPAGVLILFVGVAAAVYYTIYLKKLTVRYSALRIIAVQNFIGAIYFLPLFLVFEFNQFVSIKPNFELVSTLLLLSVFASSIAFIFYTIAVREMGVSKTNVFSNLMPVFTAIVSYFVLSEVFMLNKIIGMIIVIVGVFVTQIDISKVYFRAGK